MGLPSLSPRAALLLLLLPACALAADHPDLLLEVRLEKHLLSDAIGAYQQGGDVLLPLGEIARLLTIAIRSNPGEGHASGYILDEQRGFRLDLHQRSVLRGEQRESIDPALVRREADDIYVASRLLAAWLPAGFEIDMASLTLRVKPREKLPLQARLERQTHKGAASGQAGGADPGYARVASPYKLASVPFIDQTIGVDLRRNGGNGGGAKASLTSYLTADLLGAEAALYLNTGPHVRGPAARLTVGRHDPDAGLLGPFKARSVQAGSVAAPGVPNVTLGSAIGNGLLVSNRPLGQPMHFDRHKLQGDLPPGWDVELYFNEALVGFQQSRPDGRYSFDDLPLIYGANDFRLVFHGPLGQVRVARHSFLLEQAMLAKGELVYTLAAQRDDDGHQRTVAQFDVGLGKRLGGSAALVRAEAAGRQRSYVNLGLQAYFDNLIVNAAAVRSDGGGELAQLGVRSRIGDVAFQASRAWMQGFASDYYQHGEVLRTRDELRLDGQFASMPVALQARRDRLASGPENLELSARISAYRAGTAVSQSLRWQSRSGSKHADGVLQLSRRMAGVGVGGQLHYTLAPETALSALALAADKHLNGGYLVSLGLARSFSERHTRVSAALNKSLGRFGLGINGFYTRRGDAGIGVQLFFAAGQEPRRARWMTDAVPMAGSGGASLRVFLDKNRNGVMDGEDAPVSGAGFQVNGAGQLARTDADGIAWLGRLAPNQHADIAIDPSTLEDPQWQALQKGMRIVPRAGKASELEFAVGLSGDIDGTAYILVNGAKRPAGDLELQLLDGKQEVVASATSSADGYYVLASVAPGNYQLRIAPAQLARLNLRAPAPRTVQIDAEGNFVNGQDITVTPNISP